MPSYILLIKWTQKGIETLKDSPQRVELARNNLKSVGGNLNEIYFVFGKYDMVGVAEAPSDEALAKAVLTIGSRGTASIQTLKAFSEAEGLAIINGLP
ncbi:MAG: GYD domain-containing protein [Euryarchaeota archaeon]